MDSEYRDRIGKEIGRGGYGIVYECKTNPNICIKKSRKKTNCRVWSNEFAKIKSIAKHVKSLEHVKLIVPTKFEESDDECFMEMPRIHNPLGGVDQTLHPLLGEVDYSYTDKKRGMFMGMKQLQEQFDFSDKFLKQIARELGIMMSNIHFKAKNDAYDIEIFLGTDTFYLADFDLTEEIVTFDPETIERMVWSLDAVPYFPTMDCCPDLYKIFKDGYFSNLNTEQKVVATLVFDLYN